VIRTGRPVPPASNGAGTDAADPLDPFATSSSLGSSDSFNAQPKDTYTRSRRESGEGRGPERRSPERRDPGRRNDPEERNLEGRSGRSQQPARSLKGRAIGYLSRREYSRAELARKLTPFLDETDSLEGVLDDLEREGWLSDSRFAESLIHRRAGRLGASRVIGELKRHALGQSLIDEASARLRESELARAQAVWRKKYGTLPETPAERARQARFLAARGFSLATIGKILKGIEEEWSGD
jgi:regulatory protein